MNPRRSKWWLCLLLIPLAFGLSRLRFDVEMLNLLPAELPVVHGLKLYQQHFANARELVVSVDAPDPDTAEATARQLATALRQATNLVAEVSWMPPWLEHPEQSGELIGYLWLNQPPEAFGALTDRLAPQRLAETLRQAQVQLATSLSPDVIARRGYDPCGFLDLPEAAQRGAPSFTEGQELFAAGDDRFRIFFVQARPDISSYGQCRAWFLEMKGLINGLRQRGQVTAGVTIRYTGRPAFVTEISGGMERDITSSVSSTVLVILLSFWLAHRRWLPLGWLLTLLAVTLAGTLAVAGLIFHTLNVISVGFAAILLGLAVDYGLVLYQEAMAAPRASVAEIRRGVGPSIIWAAITTAGAFAVLNLSDLPGLAQLGSLVSIGIGLGAAIMLALYLPPLLRGRRGLAADFAAGLVATPHHGHHAKRNTRIALGFTLGVTLLALLALKSGFPKLDSSADALRPKHSDAYATLAEIKRRMNSTREPCWLVLQGRNEQELAQKLRSVAAVLERASSNGLIARFNLPTALWPRPDFQTANRATAALLAAQQERIFTSVLEAGFTSNSLALAASVVRTWNAAAQATGVFWPTNESSRWIFERFLVRGDANLLIAGLVVPAGDSIVLNQLNADLPSGAWLTGWELLGPSVLDQVRRDFWRVLAPMAALLLISLWLAFRRIGEIVLSLLSLGFGFLCLFAVMRLAGCAWNLMNLMAVPLILGAGVDYSIHMQLALRRHHGNVAAAQGSVGRALWLCGVTTVAGFGSNAWASNLGMASLGQVCATAILALMLTGIYLLPYWWLATVGPKTQAKSPA